jgi:hypothetical protein
MKWVQYRKKENNRERGVAAKGSNPAAMCSNVW